MKTVAVTYSCKSCKKTEQRVYEVREEFQEWHGSRYLKARYALKNDSLHGEYKFTQDGSFCIICECGKYAVGKPVNGIVNPSIACNVKCTGAKGHVCECSCGGANHGASYRIA